MLLYLYYALDNRSRYFQMLFWVVDVVRRFSSLLPQALLGPFATLIAACVYLPLARTARALERAGLGRVASSIPLSFYANLSFETMRNDSLDRFGTRLEKRYTRLQVRRLLEQVGLRAVTIAPSAPYWHGIGIKPRSQDLADEFPALLAER